MFGESSTPSRAFTPSSVRVGQQFGDRISPSLVASPPALFHDGLLEDAGYNLADTRFSWLSHSREPIP